MKKSKKPTIYAFIDSQNLNLGIIDCGWKLDLSSLLRRFGSYVVFISDLKQKLQTTKKERY